MTIKQEVINDLLDQFTTVDTGEDKRGVIHILKSEASNSELHDFIRDIHEGMLPDDFKYRIVHEALEAISEQDELDYPAIEADIYTHDLIQWSQNLSRHDYINTVLNDAILYGRELNFADLLRQSQQLEIDMIINEVYSFVEERIAESENAYDDELEA
tara:strand:+ start:3791 stop:4264 length:474 start_codon:yes stop_codon:yes gene_type:complete